MQPIRILIVDDHDLARRGTASVFTPETGIEVVGMAVNGQEALNLAAELLPDIVLMDISMPIMDGLEATQRLKQIQPNIYVLVLTMLDTEETVRQVMRAGAEGYVLKSIDGHVLVETIKAVNNGIFVFPPLTTFNTAPAKSEKGLTARQLQIARLWAKGLEAKEIARALPIETRTVEKHIADIYQRTHTNNKIQVRDYLEQYGLL